MVSDEVYKTVIRPLGHSWRLGSQPDKESGRKSSSGLEKTGKNSKGLKREGFR